MRTLLALCSLALVSACAADPVFDPTEVREQQFAVRVCAEGPTVEGIDVSKWQGPIDWDQVAADGVRFAFIRVNHGLADTDERFVDNWSEAQRVGVIRGAYQYFIPSDDPVAQAELLLDYMGPLEEGDLPPVLDVEEADGQSPEQIRADIQAWMDVVEPALGVKPLIYTAKYFWQDGVGAPADFLDHPLWVANYQVDCPLIADPWQRWDFWQYTSTGGVSGISGNVDRDVFNGTEDELFAMTYTAGPTCGDGVCDAGEDSASCSDDCTAPDPEPDPDPRQDPDPEPEPRPEKGTIRAGCDAGGASGAAAAWLLLAALLAVPRRRRGDRPAGRDA